MAAEESVQELVIRINKAPQMGLTRTLKAIIESHSVDKIRAIINDSQLDEKRKSALRIQLAIKLKNNAPDQPVIEEVAIPKRMQVNERQNESEKETLKLYCGKGRTWREMFKPFEYNGLMFPGYHLEEVNQVKRLLEGLFCD